MITCPWCGTNYLEFQSNCSNCGGSLPLPASSTPARGEAPPEPPPPPRRAPRNYALRIFLTNGWAIVGFVFTLLGGIFFLVGFVLTIAIITAPFGIPFAFMGLGFLVSGIPLLIWRYTLAQKTVILFISGLAAPGEVLEAYENLYVRINDRHAWVITYSFQVDGEIFEGKVTTLRPPGSDLQPGSPVYILYMDEYPSQNTLYPTPSIAQFSHLKSQ